MEEFKGYLELDRSQQQDFLYSLSFQESIYTLAHDHGLNRSILNTDSDKKSSLLIVKCLITQMYQQNLLIFSANDPKQNLFFGQNTDLYCRILFEAFTVVLEIPFSLRERPFIERKEMVQFLNLRSIHSIFPFLEDKFSHSNYVVDILLPHSIHLEILVQTLRYWIKDASSLHLLRFFLHQSQNWNSFIIPKQSPFFFSKKRIKDYSSSYITLKCVNMNLSSFLCVTNLFIYDQYLLKLFLNVSISMKKWNIF